MLVLKSRVLFSLDFSGEYFFELFKGEKSYDMHGEFCVLSLNYNEGDIGWK